MSSNSCLADVMLHQCTASWLDELRSEVNVLFKMMLNAIDMFIDSPDRTAKYKNRRKISLNGLPDAKALEVTLMELLSAVANIRTLIPASDTYDGLRRNIATGCMTTPYTQTEPKNSYVEFLRLLNDLDSNNRQKADNLSSITLPEITYFQKHSTPKKPCKENILMNFNETNSNNPYAIAGLSDELRWEKAESASKKKKKRSSSHVKFTVRKSTDTFASALRDGATKRDSEIQFKRDRDSEIVFDENNNELRMTSRNFEGSSHRSSSSSHEQKEFNLPRYLSKIHRVKSKESVTAREIEFDKATRKYFDFQDFYDRIMSHSEE